MKLKMKDIDLRYRGQNMKFGMQLQIMILGSAFMK